MGENGAGKSTLIKALTGVYAIDCRRDRRRRRAAASSTATGRRPGARASARSTRRSTSPEPVRRREHACSATSPAGSAGIDWQGVHRRAAEHLERSASTSTRARCWPSTPSRSSSWSPSPAPWCVDAGADPRRAHLQPGPDEVEQLFAVMRELRDRGVAILFVTHFLDQVYEISDRMTILRNGQLVGERLVEDLPARAGHADDRPRARGPRGARREAADAARSTEPARPVLKAIGVGRKGSLEPADLDVYTGEVVGIAGLLGSGRTELARLLSAPTRADTGEIHIDGEHVAGCAARATPSSNGIAFSSEDRKAEGIVGDLTVAENIVLAHAGRAGLGPPDPAAPSRTRVVAEYIEALDIRPADPDALVAQPVRRQPAEGAAGPLAGHRARAAHPRRAHPRHRRRRQGRDPAQGRRAGAAGHVGGLHLRRARGGAPAQRPHRRDAGPPQDRRARLDDDVDGHATSSSSSPATERAGARA